MNKEFIIAISLGFTVGLIVMYGVWTANRSMKEFETVSPIPTQPIHITNTESTATDPVTAESQDLLVVTPYKHELTDETELTVSGTADPDNLVVVLTELGQFATNPNESGEFSQIIELEKGINTISVFAIDSTGVSQQVDRVVTLADN